MYRDEEAAVAAGLGGIIAPPTFVVAGAHFDPDYPLRPASGRPWFGSGREADAGSRRPGPGMAGGDCPVPTRHRSTPSSTSNTTGRSGQETS